MALTILNSVSSLTAENALSNTQASLQKTLNRLSTGLKVNNGSDDAAGLSIAAGLTANIAALNQSQQNASNSIGLLQTADGALSQVSTLLNRAVTLSTEAANSGITTAQSAALQKEYQSICDEIDQIGTNTNFNGNNVFSTNAQYSATSAVSTPLTLSTAMTVGDTVEVKTASTDYTYTATDNQTVQDVIDSINANAGGVTASLSKAGQLVVMSNDSSLAVTTTGSATIGTVTTSATPTTAASTNSNVSFLSDGTSTTYTNITTAMNAVSASSLGLTSNNLTTAAGAEAVLTALSGTGGAIETIASERGGIGSSINRLTAANNVMSNQVTNLQSADNAIQNADIAETVADMTQYNILQSTGMSALQQSNQAQQAVLKLVQ